MKIKFVGSFRDSTVALSFKPYHKKHTIQIREDENWTVDSDKGDKSNCFIEIMKN